MCMYDYLMELSKAGVRVILMQMRTYLGLPDMLVGRSGVKIFKTGSNMMGLKGLPASRTISVVFKRKS